MTRTHWVFAAAYDTGAAIERAGFTFEQAEYFDPYPRLVPARPMLEAVARPPDPAG
jgi:hypothetical protein